MLAYEIYHIVVKSGPLIIHHETAEGKEDNEGFQEHVFEILEDYPEVDILCYRVTENGELIYDFLKLDKEDNQDILEDLFSSLPIPVKVEYMMICL